ncbi:UNVERIFIED_CONTAM: hypothetical protein PYX00_010486 [Menopon gallinae]|uniref:pyridoxal 5'-phosphate synthase n=1 Tax=Menopon gallinae TaxID=328185 RepID=A0AAW2HFW7_9NEOP
MIFSFGWRCRGCSTVRNIFTMAQSKSAPFSIDLGAMRIKYKTKNDTFSESDLVSKDPILQFKHWFDIARETPGILEANAMCLCTCTKDGFPSARYVLLKGYGKDGFKFFTNYSSRKGIELTQNPRAALVFYWEPLKRSVRIEGNVEKLSDEESDNYFHSRPKESQISACSSNQSTVIQSRSVLTDKETELKMKYSNDTDVIPRPENWGGYIVIPHSIEFWQGQSDRMHDRVRFRHLKENEQLDEEIVHKGEDGWVYERLSP